jgi:hypothetical protein
MGEMKRTICGWLAMVVGLGLAATAAADEAVKLFNGRDLAGWGCYLVEPGKKLADVWSVKDGVLVCKGEPMGYLSTGEEFTDFKLVVEWRWAPGGKPGNSGVLLRITGEPRALPECYEAQLQHGNAGDIYGFQGRPVEGEAARKVSKPGHELGGDLSGLKKIMGAEKPAGEWNRYEITLQGDKLSLVVNGEPVNEASGLKVVPGRIGFQSEGGEIQFRTIELTRIR